MKPCALNSKLITNLILEKLFCLVCRPCLLISLVWLQGFLLKKNHKDRPSFTGIITGSKVSIWPMCYDTKLKTTMNFTFCFDLYWRFMLPKDLGYQKLIPNTQRPNINYCTTSNYWTMPLRMRQFWPLMKGKLQRSWSIVSRTHFKCKMAWIALQRALAYYSSLDPDV